MHNISHYLSNLTIYPVIYLSAYVDNYFLIEKHFKYQQFTLTYTKLFFISINYRIYNDSFDNIQTHIGIAKKNKINCVDLKTNILFNYLHFFL